MRNRKRQRPRTSLFSGRVFWPTRRRQQSQVLQQAHTRSRSRLDSHIYHCYARAHVHKADATARGFVRKKVKMCGNYASTIACSCVLFCHDRNLLLPFVPPMSILSRTGFFFFSSTIQGALCRRVVRRAFCCGTVAKGKE